MRARISQALAVAAAALGIGATVSASGYRTVDNAVMIDSFRDSFVGRCSVAFEATEWAECELANLPPLEFEFTGLYSVVESMRALDHALGIDRMMNISRFYAAANMTAETCVDAFKGQTPVQCAFLLSAEQMEAATGSSAFAGIPACAELAYLQALPDDDTKDNDDIYAEWDEQCETDSLGVNSRRRALWRVPFGKVTYERRELQGLFADFTDIANRCDEIAPNTVPRPPTDAPSAASAPTLSLLACTAVLPLMVSTYY